MRYWDMTETEIATHRQLAGCGGWKKGHMCLLPALSGSGIVASLLLDRVPMSILR